MLAVVIPRHPDPSSINGYEPIYSSIFRRFHPPLTAFHTVVRNSPLLKMEPPNEFSWVVWAASSPYSPLNLGHLPQPVPNDAPLELQDGTFTFEDAFEDLLAVTSGQRLMNIKMKYDTRKMLRQMFPDGEDASFWVRRLQSQRLLENSNFYPLQAQPFWPHDVWDAVHREFSRAAEEARKAEERWSSHSEENGQERSRKERSLFDELDKLIHSFESGMNGEKKGGEEGAEKKKGEETNTEDDLYSSVQSAIFSGAKSLGTLVKMARDGVADIQNSHSSSSYTQWGRQKGDRVESREEFTDEAGNLHEKRIIRTLDNEGKEIGREVHVRVRSLPPKQESQLSPKQDNHPPAKQEGYLPPKPECQPPVEDHGKKEAPREENKEKKGKGGSSEDSGWFWK